MEISLDLVKSPVLHEFFNDTNVYFPEKPDLINGISIYDAPHGLGLHFRGGPKKLVVKGKNTPIIWEVLNKKLNGENSLEELIKLGLENNIDVVDLCSFLKILHCNHLFKRHDKQDTLSDELNYTNGNQIKYFDRLVGVTGFNNSGTETFDRIKKTKLLLICSSELVQQLLIDLKLSGYDEIGLLYLREKGAEKFDGNFWNGELMTSTDITSKSNDELNDLLFKKADDYNFIVSALNNPSDNFLKNISSFCSNRNKSFLPINLRVNNYEVGPFFIPKVSACSHCYTLRNQSSDQKSVYDFAYQNNLKENKQLTDENILGYDVPSFRVVLNVAISELIRCSTDFSKSFLANRVFELNTLTYDIKYHDLIKVSGCYACS